MASILTMDTGLSPGAFPRIEKTALINIENLDWVNVMVAGWDTSDT